MMNLPFLAQRMFNTPLAIHPAKAEVIVAALADRMGITHAPRLMEDDEPASGMAGKGKNPRAGYDCVHGVAVIPVAGTLVQKLGTLRPYSGMTGYDGIRQNVLTALTDPDVKGIFLDIDSPGGEVAGCFDLVDTIYQARDVKPIWAMSNERAYSAGYAIASAAQRVIVPRTGGTGSVGVVVIHYDWSDAIAESGLKVTIVTRGDLKAEGNPYTRLSKDAQARIQADIDTMGELFEQTTARNRNLSPARVRDLQAACFLGSNGVDVGLADEVMAPDAAFLAFVESLDS